MKKCRYCCTKKLNNFTKNELCEDVCNEEECDKKIKSACITKLKCDHWCCGFKGEKDHLVCLHEDCNEKN